MSDHVPYLSRSPFSPFIHIVAIFPISVIALSHFMEQTNMNNTLHSIYNTVSSLSFKLLSMLSIYTPPAIEPPTPMDIYLEKYTTELEKIKKSNIVSPETQTNTNKYDTPRTVIVNTPVGMIAIQYEMERAAFVYYANTSIPTKLLIVAARKYALQFHAPHLMIRRDIEHKDDEKDGDKKEKKKSGGMHSGKNGARFAKLKSAAKPKDTKENNDKDNIDNSKNNDNKNTTEDADPPRFICIGRISDMKVLRVPEKKNNLVNKYTNLTFADFKKQNINLTANKKYKYKS